MLNMCVCVFFPWWDLLSGWMGQWEANGFRLRDTSPRLVLPFFHQINFETLT